MKTFYEFLTDPAFRLWLVETFFTLDAAKYNQLFDDAAATTSVSSPENRQALEGMRGFNWVGYIAKCLRNAGYRDQREVAERTHDIAVKFLTGGLFRDYDEAKHGPIPKRWAAACRHAVINMIEKDWNRGRNIPTVPIGQEFTPGGVGVDELPDRDAAHDQDDDRVIEDFRQLVRSRLGHLGIAVMDARLSGQETKTLIGREDLGSPGGFQIKTIVHRIKALCREYAERLGDPALLRDVLRAMAREGATVQKRLNTTAARKDQRG